MTVLRAIAEMESLALTLKEIKESIGTNQRFVRGFSRQIDEGFLGKFEVAAEIQLERAEKRLSDARAELRHELEGITEDAFVEHAATR